MDCSVPLNSITPADLFSVTSTQISGAPLARPLTLDAGIIYSSCIAQETLSGSAIDSFSNYVSVNNFLISQRDTKDGGVSEY